MKKSYQLFVIFSLFLLLQSFGAFATSEAWAAYTVGNPSMQSFHFNQLAAFDAYGDSIEGHYPIIYSVKAYNILDLLNPVKTFSSGTKSSYYADTLTLNTNDFSD